jgi:signal transduction histidine kinase
VGIDVSAFRIIQESLTNVVRHAGGDARCAVTVAYEQDALTIEVADDGGRHPRQAADTAHSPGRPGVPCSSFGGLPVAAHPYPYFTGSGHGLIGMRERVQLCGGILNAGPLATGGFRVWTRLPIPAFPPAAPAPASGPVTSSEPELELIR